MGADFRRGRGPRPAPRRAGRIVRRAGGAALVAALAIASSAQAGGGAPTPGGGPAAHELYEWLPSGPENGPFLIIEVKHDITGKFAVQCGKTWIFSYYGGGEADPIVQDPSTGAISGSYTFGQNSAGIGSTFLSASTDYYLVKKAGPLLMTLNAQPTPWPSIGPASASGTLSLTLYSPGSTVPAKAAAARKRKKHRHRAKPRTTVVASCQVQFDAPNHYPSPTG